MDRKDGIAADAEAFLDRYDATFAALATGAAKPVCKRHTLAELLEDAEAMKQLTAEVAWARKGGPVGDEVL